MPDRAFDAPTNGAQNMGLNDATPSGGGGFNFRYIYATVRANQMLVIAIFAICLIVAIVLTLLQTPRYTAKTTIQINSTSGRILSKDKEQDQSDEISSQSDTDRFLKTQVDILRSRGLALRVGQRLKLLDNPAFYAAQNVAAPKPGTPQNQVEFKLIGLLQKYLDVNLPRDTRIATITFESNDPQLSADIANAYTAEFIQSNLRRKFESSGYAREFLARQLTEVKTKYEASERSLNAYAREAGLIDTTGAAAAGGTSMSGGARGPSVTTSSLIQLNQAANDAKTKRILAENRWQTMSAGGLMNSSEIVSNAAISNLLSQKAGIETALEEERARHLDDYPTVASKRAQLAAIKGQIQAAATNIRNAVQAEYLSAVKVERDLTAQVKSLKTETLNEQDRTVQYGLLAHEVETNKQLYDGLLQRYKELNATAGISTSNTSVIDEAPAPLRPSSPILSRNVLYGVAAGIFAAILVLAIKAQFDDAIRIPEDVENKLGIPLLGVVPVTNSTSPIDDLEDPKSQTTESYNSIRGSMLYATTRGLPHTMLVTSAQPAEGKSTSSYALAMVFARMGKRVVLFDADLRRPSQHRLIDDDNSKGLSTLLTTMESVESIARPTPQPNLFLVPSGPIPPSPTELLASRRMREVIEEAKAHFEVAIFDSPPILGLADSPELAAMVDGVVFVVEADRSRHGALKASIARVQVARKNLLGAILTKFDPLKSASRYSTYYGYEYYHYQYQYNYGNS